MTSIEGFTEDDDHSFALMPLVEGVVPPGNDQSFTKLLDLHMLVVPGGKERTEVEYRTLLDAAGFVLNRIIPTKAEISVIEGVMK